MKVDRVSESEQEIGKWQTNQTHCLLCLVNFLTNAVRTFTYLVMIILILSLTFLIFSHKPQKGE